MGAQLNPGQNTCFSKLEPSALLIKVVICHTGAAGGGWVDTVLADGTLMYYNTETGEHSWETPGQLDHSLLNNKEIEVCETDP